MSTSRVSFGARLRTFFRSPVSHISRKPKDPGNFPPFTVKDQQKWQEVLSANKSDPIACCILNSAARWANLMEQEMDRGRLVSEVAEATKWIAIPSDFSGGCYEYTVRMLADHWKYGKLIQQWHNEIYSENQMEAFEYTEKDIVRSATILR